jgi:hypothetical protein
MSHEVLVGVASLLFLVALVLAYLLWRRGLPKVQVEHGLHPGTSDLAARGITAAESVAERGFQALSDVAQRASDVVDKAVAPLSQGVGNVLNAAADRIRTKQQELNELRTRSLQLAQEVERLKSRQIDVTSMTAQLKLSLIELKQQYHSWEQKTLEQASGSAFKRSEETEYAGLRRATYNVHIGVDVDELRFEVADGGRILVEGLRQPRIIGIKDLKIDNVFDEVRLHVGEGTVRSGHSEILKSDSRVHGAAAEHTKRVMAEVQAEQSVQHFVGPNAALALAFLNACFSPAGYRVEEASAPIGRPLGFLDMCGSLNARVQQEMVRCVEEQGAAEMQSLKLQEEVLQLAMHAA